jgi:hypothetical protein
MDSMLNIVNTLRPATASRDDYGVSELLEAVSKRSSLPDAERQEITKIVGRVRTSVIQKPKPKASPVKQQRFWDLLKGRDSPTHPRNEWKEDFLKKDDLLRGFGTAPTVASPAPTVVSQNNAGLMRDFGTSSAIEVDSQSNSDGSTTGSEGFEDDQKL